MTMPQAPAAPAPPPGEARTAGRGVRLLTFVGTILIIIALSILPLLTPFFIHPALDAAGSANLLGLTPAQANEMSDRSLEELVLGPGTFAFEGPSGDPFYDDAERGHLRDARALLWIFLALGAISAVAVVIALALSSRARRASIWRVVSRAGGVTTIVVVVIGIVAVVAFDTLFLLFHQIFFPAGNFAFDPGTQRLVQLYPLVMWQIAAGALGILVFGVGALAWLLGRYMSRRSDSSLKAPR
ncbi:MAG: DUF1461 domain-containing protein [Chloroflexota bacterium]